MASTTNLRPSRRWKSARKFANEATAGREFARLALRAPWLARATRGNGQPVMLFPGFGAGDGSNLVLRRYLGGLGYDVYGWGLGRNRGDLGPAVHKMRKTIAELAERREQPVHLIGWSLGGVVARAVAREHPEAVVQVITYGSPIFDRNRRPVNVPITAIHSRGDGIVHWRSCIDDFSPNVENLEVHSPHLGMGVDPDVWRIITDRLGARSEKLPA